jgi:hypothetical protein
MKIVVGGSVLLLACSSSRMPPGTDSNTCASGSGGCGLVVPWVVLPGVPTTLSPGVTIESVQLKISSLRVIGDADPGDPRTTQASFTVAWDSMQTPPDILFGAAPSGLYSFVAMSIDGALVDDSYLITGHAVANGTTYPFTIHDRFALSVNLTTSTELDPGSNAKLPVQIDLGHCVGAVDWNLVHIDNNVLNLDTDDEWIPTFRQKLIESFSIAPEH